AGFARESKKFVNYTCNERADAVLFQKLGMRRCLEKDTGGIEGNGAGCVSDGRIWRLAIDSPNHSFKLFLPDVDRNLAVD
ncbi:UNVERIFIED_CONTAM: hypothetical protein NY603_39160, partial [Bacteroidetes bacterium 56_B9]